METIGTRIDRAVHCEPRRLVPAPPAPNGVKIELARTCNFSCKFCNHSNLPAKSGHMEWSLYTRIIDELKQIGVREVAPFFYGESFTSPRLADAIQYASDKGFANVFLTTNGSLAYPEAVAACMKAGLKSLKFSMNYADAKQFNEITGRQPSWFARIASNVREAKRIRDEGKYECSLSASYILYDEKQAERMKPFLDEMRPYLDQIYALPMYGIPSTLKNATFVAGNTGRAENPVPPLPCWVLFTAAHINYDGEVFACSFNVGEEFAMGNLEWQSFMSIWHSEKFQALRRAHLALDVRGTACERCIIPH